LITLSVDTSAKSASTALTKDGRLLAEAFNNTSLTHSQTLLPMIHDMLKNACIAIDRVDLFACVQGPGSFTGLRIGISAVKGLALGLDKKCVGVSTLEAMSYNLLSQDAVACCVMDARCEQVYNAMFSVCGNEITRLCDDRAVTLSELAQDLLKYSDKKIILVGDGAELSCEYLKNSINVTLAPEHLRYQRAFGAALASIGKTAVSADGLVPSYLRLPQATRELNKRKPV